MKLMIQWVKRIIYFEYYSMKVFKYIILWIILFILTLFLINLYVLQDSKDTIYTDIDTLPEIKVWLVFWASVYRNGTPSPVLRDRLDGAYDAYRVWKVQRIIVSWDNSVEKYDEPTAMANYLIQRWIPKQDIFLDYAGFDTFDSIYRANYIFWISEMILFTQEFHLKRALYIADGLDIEAIWFATDYNRYQLESYNNRREFFSRIKAFLEIEILNAKPKFLWDPILIP